MLPPLPSMSASKDVTPITDEERSEGLLSEGESRLILDATLSPKHRQDRTTLVFIESFVRCKNIKQASAEAAIKPETGYLIRNRKDVANCIQRLIDRSAIKYGFDASEIMERTKEIVDFDPIAVQNPDGTYKDSLYDIPAEARRNIKKLKVKNLWGENEDINGIKKKIIIGKVIEYEFYDKMKAIDLAGKEKEMFKNTTKVEHGVTKDMAAILLGAAKRGEQAKLSINPIKTYETTAVPVEEDEGESDD